MKARPSRRRPAARGPFDPLPRKYRYDPSIPPAQAGYAVSYLVVDGLYRWPQGLFGLQQTVEEWEFRQSREILLLPRPRILAADFPVARPARTFLHSPTGWHFRDEAAFYSFLRCYETRDLTGVVWKVSAALDPAPRRRGRPADAEWRTWTLSELVAILKAGAKNVDKKPLRFGKVAVATGYTERDLRRAMEKLGYSWDTITPLLND